jgi:hypothetical protein
MTIPSQDNPTMTKIIPALFNHAGTVDIILGNLE